MNARVWPIPFVVGAVFSAFLAFMVWLAHDAGHPSTVPVTQEQAKPAEDVSDWTASWRMCNKQVAVLLATKDQLEFDRAALLIKQLDCGIGKRLPRDPG